MRFLARLCFVVVTVPCVLALVANFASAGTKYLLQPLAAVGDEVEMVAAGVNNARQVVGHIVDFDGHSRATLWDAAGQMRLPALTEEGVFSQAFRINESGQIAGRALVDGGNVHATLWSDAGVKDLGTLSGDGDSFASDINDHGVVAGSSTAEVGQSAFTWTEDGGFVDYGNTNPPFRLAVAGFNGINNHGLMAGTTYVILEPFHAAVAHEGDRGVTDLSPPGRNSVGMALAVNDDGLIVGYQNDKSGVIQATIFRESGDHDFLGTLGLDESWAQDVNQHGVIVGRAFGFESGGTLTTKAFVWEDRQQQDLLSLAVNPDGWTLIEATGINDEGVIVGNAILDGVSQSFMAIPVPEPTSAALGIVSFIAAATFAAWSRKR